MKVMTESQKRVYEYIQAERLAERPCPTIKQVSAHIGLSSVNGSQFIIDSMIKHGFLTHVKGTARSLICVPQETDAAE